MSAISQEPLLRSPRQGHACVAPWGATESPRHTLNSVESPRDGSALAATGSAPKGGTMYEKHSRVRRAVAAASVFAGFALFAPSALAVGNTDTVAGTTQ